MTAKKDKHAAIDWRQVRDRLSQAALADANRATPERVRAVLEERARNLARVPPQAAKAGAILEVVLFDLAGERYAVETNCVREIVPRREIAPLPGAPNVLAGIANLRGQILAVFDLRPILGIRTPDGAESARVIVLGRDRVEFGILADVVHEVATLRIDVLKPSPGSVAEGVRSLLRGVTADALILLDGAALLRDPRFHIDLGELGAPLQTGEKP